MHMANDVGEMATPYFGQYVQRVAGVFHTPKGFKDWFHDYVASTKTGHHGANTVTGGVLLRILAHQPGMADVARNAVGVVVMDCAHWPYPVLVGQHDHVPTMSPEMMVRHNSVANIKDAAANVGVDGDMLVDELAQRFIASTMGEFVDYLDGFVGVAYSDGWPTRMLLSRCPI